MGEWRKVHNEEVQNLYSSPSIIKTIKSKRIRWARNVALIVEKRNTHSFSVGNPEGRRPLERPMHRWVINIIMDLGEIGWDGVDWIRLAQDRDKWRALVNSVMNLRAP
jgi:hypothetical protein